jgi:hypothetical protein
MKNNISANGSLKIEKTKECHFIPENFQSKGRQEEKMTWRALLSFAATKVHIFLSPPKFSLGPPWA